MRDVLLDYLRLMRRVAAGPLVRVTILAVGLGLTETISVVMLLPVLQQVGIAADQGGAGELARGVEAALALVGLRPTLAPLLILYALIISARALLARWQSIDSSLIPQVISAHLQRRLFRAIAATRWGYFSRQRASDFTHALTAELDRVHNATYYIIALLTGGIMTAAYLLLALRLSLAMTGFVVLCGLILLLSLRWQTRVAREVGEDLSATTQDLYAMTIEQLGGMKVMKSYGAEGSTGARFGQLTEQITRTYARSLRSAATTKAWFDIGSAVILSLALYVAIGVLALPASELLVLLFIFARLMPRLAAVRHDYQSLLYNLPAFVAVSTMQAACDAAAEPPALVSRPVSLGRALTFERVRFTYDAGNTPLVLHGLDLTIPARATTALVGASGAGKSTIVDLALGLLRPTAGRIAVDGATLEDDQLAAWRARIGYVAQETFLFHDTVRANLLWAAPEASEADIHAALRAAAAADFIAGFPRGLDTIIGDRGIRLSGGERQRLALARALIRKPAILILDEATSNLDSENEGQIQRALAELQGQITILVVAHRLSTIRDADAIHVINGGMVSESGTWDELLSRPTGEFATFCRAQGIEYAPRAG